MKELKFDVVVHLAGEQIVPNYMALKLSEAGQHIILTTSRTKKQIDSLRRMFKDKECGFLRHVEVLPTDYNEGWRERDRWNQADVGCRVGLLSQECVRAILYRHPDQDSVLLCGTISENQDAEGF